MTANAMAGDRDKALQAGMNDHVAKPIDLTELFKVLGRWIRAAEDNRLRPSGNPKVVVSKNAASLPDVPGLDTASGLARCGGNAAIFLKILRKFCETQVAAPQRVLEALAAGDTAAAAREAHTLKGVAGNVGAVKVEVAARHLETAIQREADTEDSISELERIIGELVIGLASLTPVPDSHAVAPINGSASDLLPALGRLQSLLEDADSEAGDLASELQSRLLHTELAQPMRAIVDSVDDFDFDEALERLNRLRAAIGDAATDRE
jgi:HPt (histidine-containing phosphotransfer) domain-containing protein